MRSRSLSELAIEIYLDDKMGTKERSIPVFAREIFRRLKYLFTPINRATRRCCCYTSVACFFDSQRSTDRIRVLGLEMLKSVWELRARYSYTRSRGEKKFNKLNCMSESNSKAFRVAIEKDDIQKKALVVVLYSRCFWLGLAAWDSFR